MENHTVYRDSNSGEELHLERDAIKKLKKFIRLYKTLIGFPQCKRLSLRDTNGREIEMRYSNPKHQENYEKLVLQFQEAVIHTILTGEYDKQSDIDIFLNDLFTDAETCIKYRMEADNEN